MTLAYSGIRIGELCALKKSDILPNAISITKTLYNPTNNVYAYQLQTPKTKSSKRIVEVDSMVIDELKRIAAGNTISDFVFTAPQYPGQPIYPKFIGWRMKRLAKFIGISESITPHSLRHTHCSLLAEAGVSLEEIQARLGHASDEITRRIYLHITSDMKQQAVTKFSQLIQKASSQNFVH